MHSHLESALLSRECAGWQLPASSSRYSLSPSALDLLMQMLQHDRHARPTIKEALKHQFNNDGYEVEKAFLGCFGSELLRTALAEVEVELDEIVLGRWGLSPSLRNGTSDERRLCILICWPYYFRVVALIDAACHAFQVQMLLPTRMATLVTSEKYQVVDGATAPNMHGFFCAGTIKP